MRIHKLKPVPIPENVVPEGAVNVLKRELVFKAGKVPNFAPLFSGIPLLKLLFGIDLDFVFETLSFVPIENSVGISVVVDAGNVVPIEKDGNENGTWTLDCTEGATNVS